MDYLRNRRGATAVSAYSTRAQPTATVSVPVSWDALDAIARPDAFHVGDVDAWHTASDPWSDFSKTRQKLTAAKLKAVTGALKRSLR